MTTKQNLVELRVLGVIKHDEKWYRTNDLLKANEADAKRLIDLGVARPVAEVDPTEIIARLQENLKKSEEQREKAQADAVHFRNKTGNAL
ncbi:hypothetical protein [Jeotgalibacillus terrae]|uniref:Uncharacterized protein n=1 Tax=Jeotgalibacillus terrae TaxID=587735 RepID=A0ABW5ZLV4_9BACL|nr:hypothetical protein [Jeotgalibacillus terrae]MBM7581093.1 hypothetical protein [Jeotgalibacillus terrae]